MGDLLLDQGGTRVPRINHRSAVLNRPRVPRLDLMGIDFQSPVTGASNVVVGNTDLTASRAYGPGLKAGGIKRCDAVSACARPHMADIGEDQWAASRATGGTQRVALLRPTRPVPACRSLRRRGEHAGHHGDECD